MKMSWYEKVREELKDTLCEELLKVIPKRIPIIGRVAVLSCTDPKLLKYARQIGETLLKYVPNIKSVWMRIRTLGVKREPQMVHIAGDPNPIVIHKELNTLFKLDISRITFSPGNVGERARLVRLVSGKILDMFACVGNLSMPLAVRGKLVYMVEINPLAYRYLLETIRLNRVENNVVHIFADNHYLKFRDEFDHVLMGFLPEPDMEQLAIAVKAVKNGGCIHYHCAVRRERISEKITEVKQLVESLGTKVVRCHYRKVKGIAPNVVHIVIRMYVKKR